ncbi:Y-family DNA polymerase [Parahaliea sp. F7430]|uniref:Y-family DNA polymerase n=1 Tax=Sediminihaliea albiluteola TaxID=2758564 RepID=A0A7W2TUR5_9GAMM|nr:Y-family DNA polymerase [Sediminihaliea albiluteola]MBA6412255.1 Y-family DNA polymerase [Sediminihaliea albiluteola]
MFALVDCNAFYASCEQVFRPDLRGKALVVLSNNDGCIVARSKEAKALGIPDLQPYFKIKGLLQAHQVQVFSSNYPLYGDLSQRVMDTLSNFAPEIEIYSIDEMFLRLDGLPDQSKVFAQSIRDTVWQHVRIPVGVGIAPTKTLSKLASKAAKKIPSCQGVCVLDAPHKWQWLLKRAALTEVWGVGSKMAQRLAALNIHSAWDLAAANPKIVRQHSSVDMEKTIEELNGRVCYELEEFPAAKQQIYCSRSFGAPLHSLQPIQEALTLYTTRAVEKLRAQHSQVLTLKVFIHSSPFKGNYHSAQRVLQLPYPSDDLRLINKAALQGLASIYQAGHAYTKAGIGLIEILDKSQQQLDLLQGGQGHRADRLMDALDAINSRHGKGTVFLASQGTSATWKMRKDFVSPAYTTSWRELPRVIA